MVVPVSRSLSFNSLFFLNKNWTAQSVVVKKRALDWCYSKEDVIKLSLQFTRQGRQQNTIENER